MMKIGYARVSTDDQNLSLQKDALKTEGCKKICEDKISGSKASRPGLEKLQDNLREGDTLVVWRLDRLGRSIKDLIGWMTWLDESKVGFVSIQERIDTTTASGKLTFHIFAAMAEFERNLVRERTSAGLAAARARGRKGGRPLKLDDKKTAMAVQLYNSKEYTIAQICEMVSVSKPTLYKYVQQYESRIKS